MKVALIVIYNHQYNENINVIENIYKDGFSNIYHLMPFYTGNKENVIPVYENSFYFQGYIAQGLKSFFKEDYVHYFFIADDLFLNPNINENNYTRYFNLNSKNSFISFIKDISCEWYHMFRALNWNIRLQGTEVVDFLPDYKTALQKFKKMGLSGKIKHTCHLRKSPLAYFRHIKHKNKKLSYPLSEGYSDIFIINSNVIKAFSNFCGVFASTELWVEVAIPTALVLVAKDRENIVTGKDIAYKEIPYHFYETGEAIHKKYKYSLKLLGNGLDDEKILYIHPIKLSQWKH